MPISSSAKIVIILVCSGILSAVSLYLLASGSYLTPGSQNHFPFFQIVAAAFVSAVAFILMRQHLPMIIGISAFIQLAADLLLGIGSLHRPHTSTFDQGIMVLMWTVTVVNFLFFCSITIFWDLRFTKKKFVGLLLPPLFIAVFALHEELFYAPVHGKSLNSPATSSGSADDPDNASAPIDNGVNTFEVISATFNVDTSPIPRELTMAVQEGDGFRIDRVCSNDVNFIKIIEIGSDPSLLRSIFADTIDGGFKQVGDKLLATKTLTHAIQFMAVQIAEWGVITRSDSSQIWFYPIELNANSAEHSAAFERTSDGIYLCRRFDDEFLYLTNERKQESDVRIMERRCDDSD